MVVSTEWPSRTGGTTPITASADSIWDVAGSAI